MADAGISDIAWMMKKTYSDKKTSEIALRDHPTYYELNKEQGLTGEDFRYAVQTGNPQSISGSFSDASTYADGDSGVVKGEQFVSEPTLKYGVLKMSRPAIQRAVLKGRGAFFDWATKQIEGMIQEMGARLAFDLFGDGNGIRGRRQSISGNIVTLAGAKTADKFKRGMRVGASSNADGSSPRTGSTFVTKIDRANNKITLSNAASIGSFSDNDYLFALGEPGTCIEGMGLCTPLAAIDAADSFRSVNRSNDAEALAGVRIDNTAINPEDAIGDLAVDVHCMHKRISRAVVHPVKFQEIVKRLGAKVEYTNPGGNAKIGFESITIYAAGSPIRVVSDPDCPYTITRAWDPGSHQLVYLGEKPVHWIRTADGGQYQWAESADTFIYRAAFHGNYTQPDTSQHGVASIAE